jgi:hypothetical protein
MYRHYRQNVYFKLGPVMHKKFKRMSGRMKAQLGPIRKPTVLSKPRPQKQSILIRPIILDNTAQIRTTHIYYFPEWLFMTRIFELFGVILCLVATTVQICFLPTRNIKKNSRHEKPFWKIIYMCSANLCSII